MEIVRRCNDVADYCTHAKQTFIYTLIDCMEFTIDGIECNEQLNDFSRERSNKLLGVQSCHSSNVNKSSTIHRFNVLWQ